MSKAPCIVWFRNDLRLADHPALLAAHKSEAPIICVFIHEPKEHGLWKPGEGSRFWLYHALKSFQEEVKRFGGKLILREGDAATHLMQVIQETKAERIYWNHLYEPALIKRDAKIKALLENEGLEVHTFHGNLLFDPKKILALHGKPYRAFTPFKKCALRLLQVEAPLDKPESPLFCAKKIASLSLAETSLAPLSKQAKKWEEYWKKETEHHRLRAFAQKKIRVYKKKQDYSSLLSPYLHFGQISPKEAWHETKRRPASTDELLWREFAYHMLLAFPHAPLEPLRAEFKRFPWVRDSKLFQAWKEGNTGHPYIDAGMRQLRETGWMHAKVRIAVASFLIKDLLIPWQEGAKWFWEMLVDADLANNTMNWQWCAGSGADSAPFFQIFNPIGQGKKFDPEGAYIRQYIPELKDIPTKYIHAPWDAPQEILEKAHVHLGKNYPYPVCDHKEAREKALQAFQQIVKKKRSVRDEAA